MMTSGVLIRPIIPTQEVQSKSGSVHVGRGSSKNPSSALVRGDPHSCPLSGGTPGLVPSSAAARPPARSQTCARRRAWEITHALSKKLAVSRFEQGELLVG